MRVHPIAAVLTVGLLVVASSAVAAEPKGSLGPSDRWVTALPTDLDGAFKAVAQGIRFEPYAGVLRGARGTAISGAGNSWDKAVLLAELLRRGGYQVRFAEGKLDDGNVAVLLRGTYPPKVPAPKLGPELAPYDPMLDSQLRKATATHVWIEVNQGKSWLPIDPSFPRAKVGEAYAVALRHFTKPPDEAHQRVRLTWFEDANNGKREVARYEARTADVGLQPLSLVATGVPLNKAPEKKEASTGGAAGLFGSAFGGGADKKEEPKQPPSDPGAVVGVRVERSIQVGSRTEAAAATVMHDGDEKTLLVREWLDVTVLVPGLPERTERRELLEVDRNADRSQHLRHRRYSVGVFPGFVPLGALDEQVAQARALEVEELQSEAKKLGRDASPAGADRAGEIEKTVGPVAGHLIALTHAQTSDAVSEQVGRSMGVRVIRHQPRVLIASVETTGAGDKVDSTISLDLRLDEVHAIPWPGQGARAPELFQLSRGMFSSAIEGQVVAQATGKEVPTTAALIAQANSEQVKLVALAPPEGRTRAYRMQELNDRGRKLILAALERGRHVIVPEKAVTLGGRSRVGWWEIDPATGAATGVLDDGLHQAMVDYSISVERIGMNADTGKVLGLMVGAITTETLLAAKVLEHGGINAKALKEIKELLEGIVCSSCPKGEAKVSFGLSGGNDCMSVGKSYEAGVGGGMDFCDSYADGFQCSAAIVLAAYEDDPKLFETSGSFGYEEELCVGGKR